jgi:PAS domain S-box-containing protein
MEELRKKAENLFHLKAYDFSEMTNPEMQKLIEELQIFQIELQIQNEELRASQLEIEKSKSKYFNLFDLAPIGYLVIDESAVIQELNLKACEIFERRKEHLMNHPFVSMLENTYMSGFFDFFELAKKNQVNENLDLKLNIKGSARYIEISINKYIDNNFLLIVSDTTKKKQAELKVKASELQLKIITDNIPVFISYINSDQKILFANKKYESFYGIPLKEIIGKPIHELLSHEAYEKNLPYINKALNGEEIRYEIESVFSNTPGSIFDVALIPDKMANGASGYFALVQDISERKFFESNIIKAKNFHKKILDDFPALIWLSGLDKQCTFFNKTWLQFRGRTLEQEYGYGWAQGVHPDDVEYCFNTYTNSFDNRVPFEMEYRLKNHKAEYRWIIDIGRPFYDLNNDFAGYIGSCYDITETKNAKTKLEELILTKDKLFSIIAHDLKSPFTSILGFSELLYNHFEDYETGKTRKFLSNINSSAKQTLNLLENLLEWAKTQTKQIHFRPSEIDLKSIINDIIKILNSSAELKLIEIKTSFQETEKVYADLNMLKTILRNLLSNAIKYSNIGGQITISTFCKDTNIAISITDSGIGMSQNEMEKLFIIDERVSLPGTANETGTGLGLILCDEFVRKHGGQITVESELGSGSTFTFTLPLKSQENRIHSIY